jgi:Protein of unknown function DUF2625
VGEASTWELVQQWSAGARNAHELLPADDATGEAALASLEGVTEWAVLGTLARRVAALVIDDWLVVLGAGGGGYPGLRELNQGDSAVPGALVVGVDLEGGGFAVNGGGLPVGAAGEVCYLAPDDPTWMDSGMGHSAWVQWALAGPVADFYEDLRWPGWREDVQRLEPGQAIHTYPPPWSQEGHQGEPHRGVVPLTEAWGVLLATARQLTRADPAARARPAPRAARRSCERTGSPRPPRRPR